MATRKFNCTFSVRETIEKTYVVTNLPVSIPEEDLDGHNLTLDAVAEDEIRTLFQEGVLSLDKGILIHTDTSIEFVKLVKTPKEIKED